MKNKNQEPKHLPCKQMAAQNQMVMIAIKVMIEERSKDGNDESVFFLKDFGSFIDNFQGKDIKNCSFSGQNWMIRSFLDVRVGDVDF